MFVALVNIHPYCGPLRRPKYPPMDFLKINEHPLKKRLDFAIFLIYISVMVSSFRRIPTCLEMYLNYKTINLIIYIHKTMQQISLHLAMKYRNFVDF